MPRRNGTRSDPAQRRAATSGAPGSARWLSTVTDPCPGKCLRAPIIPASAMPRCAATTCVLRRPAGKPEAERVPITGSAGPRVTSATGAQHRGEAEAAHLPGAGPAPRDGSAAASRAAPVDMNDGKRVRRVADPHDGAALLVDADERGVPAAAHGPLDRRVDRARSAALEVMFSATGDHAAEVQPPDQGGRRPGPPVARDDDLTRPARRA